jgi:hypothetical protein
MAHNIKVTENVLINLIKIGFASPNNFAPFLTRGATTKKGYFLWPNRLFKRLLGHKNETTGLPEPLIREIPIYGYIYKQPERFKFYTPTQHAYDRYEVKNHNEGPKSLRQLDHQSGLADILLGFLYNFENVEINTAFKFKHDNYKPDAYVKIHNEGKTYHFIIEFERTRTWQAIRDEKLLKADKVKLKKYGLSDHTKFLFIYAHERYPVLHRSIENPDNNFLNKHFKNYKHYAKDLTPNFLFTPYHNFTRLDKSVWQDSKGNPRQLIQ